MPPKSAGLFLYRHRNASVEVFLVHPGGPYFAKRDTGVWSIPKGLFDDSEDPLAAAKREFREETGHDAPAGNYFALDPVRMKGGKTIYAWVTAGDVDETSISSNTFRMEIPYKSGRFAEFPEVDRAAWMDLGTAREKIIPAQLPLLEELATFLQKNH